LRTVVEENERTIAIYSSSDGGAQWTRHASCRFAPAPVAADADEVVEPARDGGPIDVEDAYRLQWSSGMHLGPHFKVLVSGTRTATTAAAEVSLPDEA